MPLTAQDYAKQVESQGLDQPTEYGMKSAVLDLAERWRELPEKEKTTANAEDLIHKTIKENTLLSMNGTTSLVDNYATQLIAYATTQDLAKDDPKLFPPGTTMLAYMNGTAKALDDLKLSKNDVADILSTKTQPPAGLEHAFTKLGTDLLGFKTDMTSDFKARLTAKDAKGEYNNDLTTRPSPSDEDKAKRVPVDVAPSPMDDPMMKIIMMLVSAIFGVDLSSLFGGKPPETAPATPAPDATVAPPVTATAPPPPAAAPDGKPAATPDPIAATPMDKAKQDKAFEALDVFNRMMQTEHKLNPIVKAAERLSNLKDADSPDADLKIMRDSAKALGAKVDGDNPPALSVADARELGKKIQLDIIQLRSDELTVPPKADPMTPEKIAQDIMQPFEAAKGKEKGKENETGLNLNLDDVLNFAATGLPKVVAAEAAALPSQLLPLAGIPLALSTIVTKLGKQ